MHPDRGPTRFPSDLSSFTVLSTRSTLVDPSATDYSQCTTSVQRVCTYLASRGTCAFQQVCASAYRRRRRGLWSGRWRGGGLSGVPVRGGPQCGSRAGSGAAGTAWDWRHIVSHLALSALYSSVHVMGSARLMKSTGLLVLSIQCSGIPCLHACALLDFSCYLGVVHGAVHISQAPPMACKASSAPCWT